MANATKTGRVFVCRRGPGGLTPAAKAELELYAAYLERPEEERDQDWEDWKRRFAGEPEGAGR